MKTILAAMFMPFLGPAAFGQGVVPATAVHAYDGEWSVVLVCADTRDHSGLVKGYEYTFHVSIANGQLKGQYGEKDAPSSVVYSGEVGADGSLELHAVGNTGSAGYSVGKVARGTPYSYTLTGKLEATRGHAVRRELRPCTAEFGRL